MQTKSYYVFGAHSRGQTTRAYLKFINPEWKFLGYLYDNDEDNPGSIDGEKVVLLSEDVVLDRDAVVYVGTRGIYHQKIKEKLMNYGFHNVEVVDPAFDNDLRNRFVPMYFERQGRVFLKLEDTRSDSDDLGEEPGDIFIVRSAVDSPLAHEVPLRPYEKYIQAGSKLTDERVPGCEIFDNDGESISERNRQMCELTAVYWIWKNIDSPVVGIEHYRRRFILPEGWRDVFSKDNVDVILPVPLYVHPTLEKNYCQRHDASIWEIMLQVVERLYPDCAGKAKSFFAQTSCYSPCNMLIAGKSVFDEMCEWLFPILFEVIERCGTLDDAYQNRYPGFLSERLMTFFFFMKEKEYKVMYADKSFLE